MSELAKPPDSQVQVSSVEEEKSQGRVRVVIPLVSAVIIVVIIRLNGLPILSAYQFTIPLLLGYGFFGFCWLVMITRYPSATSKRRVVVIVGDLGMVSWAFVQLGASGVIFYPLFLWIIVGNGMRFGANYLLTAIVVGQIIFSSIYVFSDYWLNNLVLGLSLQSGMIILPLFYLTLMRRMHGLNERLALEAERSRSAAESKALFLANMSHELRTPMNGVLGISQLLGDTKLDLNQQQLLEVIHRSADSLLGIINDILDFSKVDAGKLTIEASAFDLRQCIDDVVQLLEHEADEKRLNLTFDYKEDSHDCFVGDRARIRQILVNLIGNAIKFTHQGEVNVSCSIKSAQGGSHEIEIVVTDTGVGVAQESLSRIFDKFEQADSSTARRFGGTGLGLAISRKLASAMEGSLEVESEIDVGTAFTFHLKLAGADRTQVDDREKRIVDRNYKLQALVVEDNIVNQMVASGLLKKLGIQVDIAENGQVALDKYMTTEYQLIFMDMQMPIMGGDETARRIRELPGEKARVPIIALSANVAGRTLLEDGGAGGEGDESLYNGFVSKPFTLQDLVGAVDSIERIKRVRVKIQ